MYEFEQDVWAKLIICQLENIEKETESGIDDGDRKHMQSTVQCLLQLYDGKRECQSDSTRREVWLSHHKVQLIKFSSHVIGYIHSFSDRKSNEALHKVTYTIIHRDTGTIITSQHKAWNDKVRMAMCIILFSNLRH